MKRISVIATVLVLLHLRLLGANAQYCQPPFTGLGNLGGTNPMSYVTSMNSEGWIIGGAASSPGGGHEATIWFSYRFNGLSFLSGAGSARASTVTSVSGNLDSPEMIISGHAIGPWEYDLTPGRSNGLAFYWTRFPYGYPPYPPLVPDSLYLFVDTTTITGLSDDVYEESEFLPLRGSPYRRATTDEYALPAQGAVLRPDSIASAISDDGMVATGYCRSNTGVEAVRWDGVFYGQAVMSTLGHLPAPSGTTRSTEACATSHDGSIIVGASSYTTLDGSYSQTQAFRWDSGSMIGLGDLLGGSIGSCAKATDWNGHTIVGWATTAGGRRAFVWDPTNQMRDLKGVLVSQGRELTGWELLEAVAISDDGTIVSGTGINPQGQLEGFRATLHTPSECVPYTFLPRRWTLRVSGVAFRGPLSGQCTAVPRWNPNGVYILDASHVSGQQSATWGCYIAPTTSVSLTVSGAYAPYPLYAGLSFDIWVDITTGQECNNHANAQAYLYGGGYPNLVIVGQSQTACNGAVATFGGSGTFGETQYWTGGTWTVIAGD